ncbi:MAG: Transcriptional regulatory protein DesR [Turneriella sp.]|nr:Transcriptional regulatory protein DesR [Turneriella sp.]
MVVEDRPVIQQRLSDLFARESNFTLCALCTSAEDAIERLSEIFCELIMVDLELPGISGEELIPIVRSRFPQIKIVVFTVFEDQARIVRLMKCGIDGYLLKDTSDDLLLAELTVIMLGGAPLSPRVARKILDDTDESSFEKNPLSERELEVLNLISLGLNYKEIADDIEISPNTVRVHISSIYEKLETGNKVETLNRARQLGLLN